MKSKRVKTEKSCLNVIPWKQERLLDHQLRPWRRSFQQSWRAPLHHHPDPKSMKPRKLSSKLELTRRLKTALFTLMPEPGQEWRLLPKEERERWRLQMPAAQFFLVWKLNLAPTWWVNSLQMLSTILELFTMDTWRKSQRWVEQTARGDCKDPFLLGAFLGCRSASF